MPPQSGLILREGTLFRLFGNICDFLFQIFLLKCQHSVPRLYCHSDIWCWESKYAKAHSANGRLHDDQIRHFGNLITELKTKFHHYSKEAETKCKCINFSTWRILSIYLFCRQHWKNRFFKTQVGEKVSQKVLRVNYIGCSGLGCQFYF